MSGPDKRPESCGIRAYDLEPPAGWPRPAFTPFRGLLKAQDAAASRYAAPPVPEGCARVELDDDYYAGPGWNDWAGEEAQYPAAIFDVPAEQRARWEKAQADYATMQGEIRALRDSRPHRHGWAPAGWMLKPPYQAQP